MQLQPVPAASLWSLAALSLLLLVLLSCVYLPAGVPFSSAALLALDLRPLSLSITVSNSSSQAQVCPCSSAGDAVDDQALFQEAVTVSACAAGCTGVTPKLALLFLTRGPLPLAPLWARFLEGHEGLYSVFVHAAPGYTYTQEKLQHAAPFQGRQIPSQEVGWAAISELDAERRLLARALLDPLNQRFLLVSETCIPIRSFPYLYSYLMKQDFTFLNSFDEENWWAGRGRYVPDIFLPEIALEQWRKGAQWFAATRRDATLIVGDTKYYSKYAAYCQAVPLCYPAEHYFPTLLYIEDPAGLANQTMTFVDWSQGGAHPKTFFPQDLSPEALRFVQGLVDCPHTGRTLWEGMDRPCWLVLRKVAPQSLEHLLGLPPDVLGY